MDRLLAIGFFGRGNAGDDAMLWGFLTGTDKLGGSKVTLATDRVPELPESLQTNVAQTSPQFLNMVRQLRHHDSIVLIGGTHFHDLNGNKRYVKVMLGYAVLFLLARLVGCRPLLANVGLGPIETFWGHWLLKLNLLIVEAASLRDQASCDVAKRVKAKKYVKGFDMAALIENVYESDDDESGEAFVVGLSVLPAYHAYYGEKKDEELINSIVMAVDNMLEQNDLIRLRVFGLRGDNTPDADNKVCEKIKFLLPELKQERIEVIIYDGFNLTTFMKQISQCDFFVGMRYHSCMFAYLSNIPLLTISYHPKNEGFLQEVGLPMKDLLTMQDVINGNLKKRLDTLQVSSDRESLGLTIESARVRSKEALRWLFDEAN